MATLSNLLGGGSAGAIDHRKEGLPLFGLFGTSGDQNDHMTYSILILVSKLWAHLGVQFVTQQLTTVSVY